MKSDASSFLIPAFGMVFHKNDRVTLGLGAYGVSGMGVDYGSNLYNNITYTKYTFMKFAPAVAVAVTDRLSLGAAPNIDYASMDYEAGTTAEKAHSGGTAFGLGGTLGLLYQLSNTVSLGLAYESKQKFSAFEFNTPAGKDKLTFDQPQGITLGAGYQPTARFRLAADISWIDWPQTNGLNKPAYTQNNSGAARWNMNWDEQFVYKLGLEYDLSDRLTLRAGFNYGKNPLDQDQPFENIAFPAIAEDHYTVGAGYRIAKNVQLNLALMYAPTVTLKTGNAAEQYIDSAETSMSQMSLDLGLACKF